MVPVLPSHLLAVHQRGGPSLLFSSAQTGPPRRVTMPDKVRVAVNGYGVIGKRVADAVRVQPDMELAGVRDVTTDYRIKTAVVLGLPVYASVPGKAGRCSGPAFRWPVRSTIS
jgi:hypothetical protein